MTQRTENVTVVGPPQIMAGAQVYAYLQSRFSTPPSEFTEPPGEPDAGPFVTGMAGGGPGKTRVVLPDGNAYYVAVKYNNRYYWSDIDAVVDGSFVPVDSLFINVQDHGIVCDGVTDNAPAINALIQASTTPVGATLYFPPPPAPASNAYYGIKSSVEITKSVVLQGDSNSDASSIIGTRIRALSGFSGGAIVRNFSSSDYRDVVTHTNVATTNGQNTITDANAAALGNAYVSALVTGSGIPVGTYITSISGTTITLSANATATANVTIQYGDINGKFYAPNYAPSYVHSIYIKNLTIDLGAKCNNTVGIQLVGIMERTVIRDVVIQNNSGNATYGNVAMGIFNSQSSGAVGRFIIDHITVYGYGWLHELMVDGSNGGTTPQQMHLDPTFTNWTTAPGAPDGSNHESSIFYFNACRGAIIEGHAEAQVPNSAAATWQAGTAYAKDTPIVVNGIQYWATAAGTTGSTPPAFYGTWQPSTTYTAGTVVTNLLGSASSGVGYLCTVGGTTGATPPAWSYTPNATFNDGGTGGVTWQVVYLFSLGYLQDNTVRWSPKTTSAYVSQPWTAQTYVPAATAGNITVANPSFPGYVFRCTTSGKTGVSEPSWNRTLGAYTTDGTAKWQCVSTDADDCAVVRLVDCPDAVVKVLFKTDQWAVVTRPIVKATQSGLFGTNSNASGSNPMSSPKLDHCILSQQPGRGWIGSIVEDYMGGLTRVLAYDPTNFNPSWITYDGATCVYGNANNYAPYYSVPTIINYTSSGGTVTMGGDVTGTNSVAVVGKIQGIAINSDNATLASQASNISTQAPLTSYTAALNETTIINSVGASPTVTLRSSVTSDTPTKNTLNTIANNTSTAVTITSGVNLRYFNTVSTTFTLPAYTLCQWRYTNTGVWALVAFSPQSSTDSTKLPLAGGTMSGAIAMGTNKITGLGNGTASTDAAAFGQIPTALPPNGSASGDLTGSYPGPTLATAYSGSSPVGSATTVPVLTIDTKGRITATSTATPSDTTRVAKAGDTMSGALAMGANKITGLANGTASTDAAAFGQIPTKGVELASTVYAPAAQTTKTQSSGTVPALLDPLGNLTVTFTAPASGKVLVELSGYIQVGTAGTSAIWNVCTHGGTTPVGTWMSATAGANGVNATTRCYVSGLTPGNSYQWDWLAQTGNSGVVTQTLTCYGATGSTAGGAGAPAIMRIISA